MAFRSAQYAVEERGPARGAWPTAWEPRATLYSGPGLGLFHGIIPSPLLMCQAPSCGGLNKYPNRSFEDSLNAKTGLFSYASAPFITNAALNALLGNGLPPATGQAAYPNGAPSPFPFCGPNLDSCGFLQPATIVRFDQNSQNPYGIQTSASLEFQPFKDALLSITGIHLRGVHLGSFYNVNQPDPERHGAVLQLEGASELQGHVLQLSGEWSCQLPRLRRWNQREFPGINGDSRRTPRQRNPRLPRPEL